MTPGARRVVLLGVVSAAAVVAAAAGWFSPPEEPALRASAPSPPTTVYATLPPPTSAPVTTPAPPPNTPVMKAAAAPPTTPVVTAPPTTPPPTIPPSTAPAPTVPPPTTSPPTTSPPPPATTIDPTAPRSVTVLLTGDILAENPVLETGRRAGAATGARYDFTPLFAPITPLVSSFDLAICQMEIPIAAPGEPSGSRGRSPYGGNRLVAPYELAPALRAAGFDRCTTASNHSFDVGAGGIDSTIAAFEGVGISWSGTARRPEERPGPLVEARGARIAHLSYTLGSNTPWPAEDWRLARATDPALVAADVAAARAAGADLVIVSLHLLMEQRAAPLPEQRSFAAELTALARVDALVHHGPHVVQGFEMVNATPVWWSVGNLLSGMARPNASDRYTDPRTRDGLGAAVRFTETSPGVWVAAPSSIVLCNEAASRVIHAGVAALADPALAPELRHELEGCVARTRAAVPDAG